jgi:hypothetical protein
MATEDNATGADREAVLTIASTTEATLSKTLTVVQEAKKGNVILFDDFENTANPLGWVIENEGEAGKGWQYSEGTTDGKAKKMTGSGTHAMSMMETFMEEIHQDAKLTSPTFAGGRTLTFGSHTNGGNATPKQPPLYLVEVSSDNGATWTQIFNVLGDYPIDPVTGNTVTPAAGYTKITLDLSPYVSETMKIRFHCYDMTNEGLQYWWQIDDVEISADAPNAIYYMEAPAGSSTLFDLQGRRVQTPVVGRIYINHGRKIVKRQNG